MTEHLIPAKCEALIVNGIISLAPLRKVTDKTKQAYKQWLIEEEARRKAEKAAQKAKHTA